MNQILKKGIENWNIWRKNNPEKIPAFSAQELWEMLPVGTRIIKRHYGKEPEQSEIYYQCISVKYDSVISCKSEVQALAKMLLWLKKQGLLEEK